MSGQLWSAVSEGWNEVLLGTSIHRRSDAGIPRFVPFLGLMGSVLEVGRCLMGAIGLNV